MPPRGQSRYRHSWGNDFSFEPLDVYAQKEAERAAGLVQQASKEKYGTPFPPLPRVIAATTAAIRQTAAQGAMQPKKDSSGGGTWKKIRRGGSAVLKALDAGTETITDIRGTSLPDASPMQSVASQLLPLIRGKEAPIVGTIKNLRDPDKFVERQSTDFRERSTLDQLVAGTVNDPTNLMGAGIGPKLAARGATVAARGGTAARISGSVMRGLGRADMAADVVQSKVGREVIGAGVGFGASAMAGGDTEQNLKAAAVGAIGGNLTRRGGVARQILRELPRQMTPAGMVSADGPNADAYFEVLGRNGIEPVINERGHITAPAKDLLDAIENPIDVSDIPLLEEVLSTGEVANPRVALDTPWSEKPLDLGDITKGKSKQEKAGRAAAAQWAEEHRGANPAELRDAVDAEMERVQAELERTTTVRRDASDSIMVRDKDGQLRPKVRTGGDRRPPRNKPVNGVSTENDDAVKRTLKAEEHARLTALSEIRDQIDVIAERGAAAPAPTPASDTVKRLVVETGEPTSDTVKQADIFGGTVDTGKTETELNGWEKPPEGVQPNIFEKGKLDAMNAAAASEGPPASTVDATPVTPSPGTVRRRRIAEEKPAAPASADAPTATEPPLPPELGGAKPRYSYGSKQFMLTFESDVDRALYIVAQANKSAKDAQYLAYLQTVFPSKPEAELRQLGAAVRSRIKAKAAGALDTSVPIRVERGAHEIGPVQGADTGRPFPRELNPLPGRNEHVTLENPGREPTRATHMPLPGEVGAGEAPRSQPTGSQYQSDHPETPATGARGAEAVFGDASGADTPASAPPAPPKAPPAPTEPGPGNPQISLGDQGPRVDWLDARPRDAAIKTAEGRGRSLTDRVRGKKRDARVEAVRLEKQRTDQSAFELVDDQVDTIRQKADAAGLTPVQNDSGDWVLRGFSEEVTLEDVVEQATDAGKRVYGELSEPQRRVIDEVRRVNAGWNSTIEAHGGTVPLRDTIEGQYFPRRVVSREVGGGEVEKNAARGSGRRLGASRIGARTQDSAAAGIEAGISYANPWDALKSGMKTKARIAQDNYLATMVRPLAQPKAAAGFGYRALSDSHPLLSNNRAVGKSFDGESVVTNQDPLVFPNEIADQLDDVFSAPSVLNTKPGEAIRAVNAVMTPLRASFDASFLLNQGLGFVESSPANAAKGMKAAVDVVASAMGQPERYAALRTAERERATSLLKGAGIDEQGNEWMRRRGVHYAGEGEIGEFQFPEWMQKVPGLGRGLTWSNETFGRYLNYARDVLANDELERAVAAGKAGDDLAAHMDEAANSINRMTGWTSTTPTGMETLAMFAPRFFRANVEQIVAAVSKGGLEGSIARAHLLKLIAIGGVSTYAINAARNYQTDLDPRSHNFLRIRDVAGRDISPFGPFATIIRGVAQAAGGDPGQATEGPRGRGVTVGTNLPRPSATAPLDFARAKASGVGGTLWSLLAGESFDGRPIEQDPTKPGFFTKTIPDLASENIPFTAQALVRNGPLGALSSATGLQSSEMTPAEKRDNAREAAVKRFRLGKDYASLGATDKAKVNQDSTVQKYTEEQRKRGLERDDIGAEIDTEWVTKMSANATYLRDGKDAAGKPFTGIDYRKAFDAAAQSKRDQLKGAGRKIEGDKVLDGYFALYDQAKMANGQTDYDKFDRLAADYTAAHPDVLAKVAKSVGVNDDATMAKLRRARAQAKAYYAIPAYRGMSEADADKAAAVLSQASALTSAGVVPSRIAAFIKLESGGKVSKDDVALAVRAAALGSNPERRKFLADNPEFAIFYKGVDAADADLAGSAASSSSSAGGFKYGAGGSSRRRRKSSRSGSRRR